MSEQPPLDPEEVRELERLSALEADGPMSANQRSRLEHLRRAPGADEDLPALHQLIERAYTSADSPAQVPADDHAFLVRLEDRIEQRVRYRRAVRTTVVTLAAAAVMIAVGAWLASLGIAPGGEDPARVAFPVIEPVETTDELDALRLERARRGVRLALRAADAIEDDAFLEQVERETRTLRRQDWPIEVLILRQVESVPDLAFDALAARRALRWLGLEKPDGAEVVLERALRRREIAAAACRALSAHGSPRALETVARLAANPEDFPFAADELARSGLRGVHLLLDLWDGDATPVQISAALARDPHALDLALAERIELQRLSPELLPLVEESAGDACVEALLGLPRERPLLELELEVAARAGGVQILAEILRRGEEALERDRAPYLDTVRSILARSEAPAPELATSMLRETTLTTAVLLFRATSRLDAPTAAACFLAYLDTGFLEPTLEASILLRLAALPPAQTPALIEELKTRLLAREHPGLVIAAFLAALATRIDADDAIDLLPWRHFTVSRRARLRRTLRDAVKEDPGIPGATVLARVETLITSHRL